jgi:hypothetical protein
LFAAFLTASNLIAHAGAEVESQKSITIGVLSIAGPHRTLANNIADLLTANLSTNENFSMVDRTRLDKVQGEMKLALSGNVDADTAAKVGHLTGAKVLVTGREMIPNNAGPMVIIINVVGTENGRVFSETAQGPRSNFVAMVADLSKRIAGTIQKQSTNLFTVSTHSNEKLLENLVDQLKGRKLPSVAIKIQEEKSGDATSAAGTALRIVFQKTGFTVVDEKSNQSADVLITGDAVADKPEKRGDVFSCSATISIRAQDRATGKLISLDLERGTAAGLGDQTTRLEAIQQAAEQLLLKVAPKLAQ